MDGDRVRGRGCRLARGDGDLIRRRVGERPQPLEQRLGERQPEARVLAAEAVGERRELRVKREDRLGGSDRPAEVELAARRQRRNPRRLRRLDHNGLHRQLVEQRLDRVRRAEAIVGDGLVVAAGGSDLDRVHRGVERGSAFEGHLDASIGACEASVVRELRKV